jgi:beta-galactosidase GanA
VEFVAAQARILHRHTDRPVGTDMMPFLDVDHYDMGRELDVVQFNHYNFFEGLRDCTLFFDYFRRVQERPFWNTETSTCWGGGTALSGYCAPGFCRANSWLPIALGGEANLYWLWRTHWAGQELTFGSVVTSQGRPRHVFAEVQEIAAGFRAAAPFLNGSSPVTTGLALHMSQGSHLHFKNQSMVHGFDYVHELRTRFYTPLVKAQYRPDVIDPSTPLDGYRVILSPFLPCLDEDGLRERLRAWIEAGGVWIAGPFTDIRTAEGTQFLDAPFGSLEDWGGVYCRHQMPGFPHAFQVRADQGDPWSAEVWCDGFELRGAEALAGYSEHELAGLAAVTSRAMGRGRVILLGTVLPEPVLLGLIERVAEPEGVVSVVDADPNLVCVPREGVAGRGLVAVEVENRPAMLCLPSPGTELLSGRRVDGALEIPAYGVVVVQYDQ